MISNIFLNRVTEYIISKDLIKYLIELETLRDLRNKDLLSDEEFLKSKVQIKKSHISQ